MSIAAKFLLWIVSVFALVTVALIAVPAKAVTIDYSRDCDKYAVMYCGSMTKAEIVKKLQNGDGQNSAKNIQDIYSQFNLNVTKVQNATYKEGVVYQNGEVKIGSKVVATNAKTYIRTMGKVSTSKMGTAQAALVAVDANGKFLFAVMTPCGNPVTGTPVEPPKPKPQSLTCDAVKVTITDAKKRTVSASVTGTATNTTISAYKLDFGDKTVVNKQSATHTYANYGKYTITAHVTGKVGTVTKTVTSAACAKVVEFKKPPTPAEQAIECTALTLDSLNREKRYVKVTVKGTAQNTKIDSYSVNFGDGTAPVKTQTAEHTYADYGEFKITANVTGKVDGKDVTVTGVNCVQNVSFTKTPESCPTNPALPIDDPKCKPCPTNPDLNYDDPKCVETIPNTGAGSVIGLASGVALLGAVGHRMWLHRKMN
jgi:chitodextrinase